MSESHRRFAEKRVMIMSAPNGARRTRADHPALPMTPAQLATEARELLDQQVSVLHLHVRDKDGGHSLDPEHYREAIAAIRKAVGDELVIQATSESVGRYTRAEQMEMVRSLRPEAVSLALRELCPDSDAEPEAGRFYEFLQKENIWPQHILYTRGDVARFDQMRKRGVLAQQSPACLLVLGNYANGQEGTIGELKQMSAEADLNQFPWAVCCFGKNEHEVMLAATAEEGHVRIGFENNLWLSDESLAQNNAQLIHQYLEATSGSGRNPASAAEVRELFLTRS